MPYVHVNFGALKTALLERLGDDGYGSQAAATFWTNASAFSELGAYLVEAIRTWNAFSWFFRARQTFELASAVPFYDVTSASLANLNPTGGVRPYTVTDQYLIGMMEYQLLEPYAVTSWTGSEMFSLEAVTQAIQRRRNQFLVETGMVLTHGTQGVSGGSNGRVVLPDTVIDVVRGCWIDALTGTATPVWSGDTWAANAFSAGWNVNAGTPQIFDVLSAPPLTLQLIPPPANQGTLDYLAVEAGPALNPAGGPTILGIPDDFTWVVKMGAVADLLGQDGPGRDPQRSQYCEQRWELGCELARQFASVIHAEVAGVAAPNLLSVSQLDRQASGWQSVPSGTQTPMLLAAAGSNLVAAYPMPDGSGPFPVTLDLVANATVPVADTDSVQVGREELDAILDYAVHLAAFKMAGQEFQDTLPHYQRLVRLAGQYNERLDASAFYLGPLARQSLTQAIDAPRRSSDVQLVGVR